MKHNPHTRTLPLAAGLCLLLLAAVGCRQEPAGHDSHAPASPPTAQTPEAKVTPRIPDYFTDPNEAKPFPVTLDPAQFSTPYVKQAYQLARDLPEVLAQQPCYCFCDAGHGHKSLLHCHIDDHSAS